MRFWRFIFIIIISLLSFANLPRTSYAAVSTDTLEGYWKFDETNQGNDPVDSSGDDNNGDPFGAGGGPAPSLDAPVVSFPNSRSADFNGENQYFEIPDNDDGMDTSIFTIAFWVKLDVINNNYRTFAGKWHVGVSEQYLVQLNDNNRIGFWTGNGTNGAAHNLEATLGLSTDTWYHVTAVANGTSKTLYINGTDNEYTATGTAPGNSNIEFTIGSKRSNPGSYFEFLDGKIDDLRFYSRVLSESEIDELASGNHTTAVWDGSESDSYEEEDNWNINAIPDPYTIVTITNAGNLPAVLSDDTTTAGVIVDNGASLDLAGFSLLYNDDGELTNNGMVYSDGIPTPTPTLAAQNTGRSSNSSKWSFSCTSFMPLSSPDLFQIKAGENNATLFFAPASGQNTGYTITYGLTEEADQFAVMFDYGFSTGVIPYTINHLFPATWYFKVSGKNGCMPGEWSHILSARIL